LLAAGAVGCQGGGGNHEDTDARMIPDAAEATDAAAIPDARLVDAEVATDASVGYPFSDLDEGCAPIFAQSIVPEYHLTIAPDQWAAMQDDFLHPVFSASGTIVDPPYHPAQLHIVEGAIEHDPPNVMIRISGNTSWLQAILYDPDPKMQFMIAFNQIDPDGRFEGLRKIKIDMPRNDWTFLQQRVGVAWLRARAGVPAPCANNARVHINGAYYGLYTNLERQDKSFLDRVYGDADDGGDLWKGGRSITTNEDDFSWAHISAFWDVIDLAGLDGLTDLDTSMHEWASEAVIGDSDGYNNGRANFYLYDQPSTQQFVWLATDLDTVLDVDYLEPDTTPILAPVPPSQPRWERDWHHYLIALNDPAGVARYVQALSDQLPKLDPAELDTWIAAWSEQIDAAAVADPHRPFSIAEHDDAVVRMRTYAPARAEYLARWLGCWAAGGADGDGDGFDLCHDCDDADAAQSPASGEVCDSIDNNCNGRVDDVAGEACPVNAGWNLLVDRKAWRRVATSPGVRR
jgi:hypothetical protein